MPGKPYTFDEMRAALVRHRDEGHPKLGLVPFFPVPSFIDPGLMSAALDRMIALIDAMTPEERTLSNVLPLSPDRQKELAGITGHNIREVQGLIAGRQSVEFVKHVYLHS